MNRPIFALGLFLALVGLAATIVLGITKPESRAIWFGLINISIGSVMIAFAFPKKE